eukprot:5507225-Prymnesium_polylepis.2
MTRHAAASLCSTRVGSRSALRFLPTVRAGKLRPGYAVLKTFASASAAAASCAAAPAFAAAFRASLRASGTLLLRTRLAQLSTRLPTPFVSSGCSTGRPSASAIT